MPNPFPRGVHPLAIISAEAELADDIVVGPYVVIEGKVRISSGCVVHSHALLCGPLTMGRGNHVHPGVVLGERPQDVKYGGEPTSLEIGDGNVFREMVTVHRGSAASWMTRIGSRNLFRAKSHVGHDCHIGDGCTLAEGALVGGHCTIEDQVHLGGNCAVHQGRRVGRLAALAGCSITTKDVPPFARQHGINTVRGMNARGMRRAGMTVPQLDDVRRAFRILFRKGLTLPTAVLRIEQELGSTGAVGELLTFLRACTQGINSLREHGPALAGGLEKGPHPIPEQGAACLK